MKSFAHFYPYVRIDMVKFNPETPKDATLRISIPVDMAEEVGGFIAKRKFKALCNEMMAPWVKERP